MRLHSAVTGFVFALSACDCQTTVDRQPYQCTKLGDCIALYHCDLDAGICVADSASGGGSAAGGGSAKQP